MSVLMEFGIFPLQKAESLSPYVSKVLQHLEQKGVPHELTAMGTIIETDTMREATEILNEAEEILAKECGRVYCLAKFDIRNNQKDRMESKVRSVREKMDHGQDKE